MTGKEAIVPSELIDSNKKRSDFSAFMILFQ